MSGPSDQRDGSTGCSGKTGPKLIAHMEYWEFHFEHCQHTWILVSELLFCDFVIKQIWLWKYGSFIALSVLRFLKQILVVWRCIILGVDSREILRELPRGKKIKFQYYSISLISSISAYCSSSNVETALGPSGASENIEIDTWGTAEKTATECREPARTHYKLSDWLNNPHSANR